MYTRNNVHSHRSIVSSKLILQGLIVLNAKRPIVHDENKFHFNEMMMMMKFGLYKTNTS